MDLLRFFTLRRLAKGLYGVVVALVLAEIGIALFLPQQEALQKDLIRRDPALGFRMKPNYRGVIAHSDIPLHTNSWGVRGREFGPKRPGVLRVYAIGDSMVFGHGLREDEAFPHFLEGILAERLGRPVEVVNGGVPGYGTVQAAEFFAQTVDTVQPDVVTLSIAVFNDLEDNVKFGRQLYRWQRDPGALQRLRTWLRHNSQVYRLFRRYRAGVSGREMMQIHSLEPPKNVLRGVELVAESVRRIAAEAEKRGIGFAVVVNPAHKQASAREWAATLRAYNLDAGEFDPQEPNRRIVAAVQAQGVPVLDLLATFRSRPNENYYFSEHWKAPGHRLVAGEIAAFLVASGLDAPAAGGGADSGGSGAQALPSP